MTRRSLAVLAAILIGLTLYVSVSERGTTPTNGAGSLLLPNLGAALETVERIEVSKAGGELVIALEPGTTGWIASNKAGYPADLAKVRAALAAIADARILEAKTANPALYDRLGVEPIEEEDATGLLLRLTTADGEDTAVLFGNEEGAGYRYARLPNEAQSYLVTENPELPSAAADWLDTSLLDIPAARWSEVVVTHADGERVRVYKEDASEPHFTLEGLPTGRELLYVGVTSTMAGALAGLRFEDVRGPQSTGEPDSVTEYRSRDGLVVTVRAFAEGDETWIAVDAAFDPAAAEQNAALPEEGAANADGTADAEAGEDVASPGSDTDPAQEAQDLDARLGDWQYRIPSYKAEQITRRIEDLLKAEP